MNREELGQLFRNKSDCYTEDCYNDTYPAMSEDRFIEVVNEYFSTLPDDGITDLEYCVQCFIRSEHLTRKWDKFRDEWFAQRNEQSLQQENQTED